MSAPFKLELAGKIDQEKQNDQRQHIKYRDHRKETGYRITFHFLKEQHNILTRKRKYNIKCYDRDQKRRKKQPVLFSASFTVACNKLKEH